MRTVQLWQFATVSLAVSVNVGCGKDYGVELYSVTGTITIDGQPLDGATVEFRPDRTGEVKADRGGIGFTNEKGKYIMLFRDTRGCPEGKFRVLVSTYSEPQRDNKTEQKKRVPRRYRGQNSELTATVTPDGDNVFDFDLKSTK